MKKRQFSKAADLLDHLETLAGMSFEPSVARLVCILHQSIIIERDC